jgi:hypothetical protein
MNKPTEDPKIHEPERQAPISEASMQQPEELADDSPPKNPGTSAEHIVVDPLGAEPPSPIKPSKPNTEEVLITGTGFREPGNPIALAKHSAKEELIERRKVKFDMADYSHLNIGEILSGYLNQVYSSRDLEIDMVKHMHQKHEVSTFAKIYSFSPQVY